MCPLEGAIAVEGRGVKTFRVGDGEAKSVAMDSIFYAPQVMCGADGSQGIFTHSEGERLITSGVSRDNPVAVFGFDARVHGRDQRLRRVGVVLNLL